MDVKNILKLGEQPSLKVVLNGGKLTLDDATVPFQIAFDQSVAKENPTYILVIDVTDTGFYGDNITRRQNTGNAERSMFKLEPTNYLQFHRPGLHHLIFMLVSGGMDKKDKQKFLGKSSYSYKNDMQYDSIEENDAVPGQIAYVEVIVEVPKEFFAKAAETKLGKAFYNWNNRWFSLQPIDQCQYRKRMGISLTIQPFVWLFMCLIRLIVAVICMFILEVVLKLLCLIFGFHFTNSLSKNAKVLFLDFVLLYPKTGWNDLNDNLSLGEVCGYKTLSIFGRQFHTPMTIFGLVVYATLLTLYGGFIYLNTPLSHEKVCSSKLALTIGSFLSFVISVSLSLITLRTIKKGKEYRNSWNLDTTSGKKKTLKAFSVLYISLTGVVLATYLIFQVNWVALANTGPDLSSTRNYVILGLIILVCVLTKYKLWKQTAKIVGKILWPFVWLLDKLIVQPIVLLSSFIPKRDPQKPVATPREVWLERSFDLNTLPAKVDVFKAPQASTKIHRFRIGFWSLKAKMCKPFPKG